MKRKRLTKWLIGLSAIFISLLIGVATVSVSAADDDCETYLYWINYYTERIEELGCEVDSTRGSCVYYNSRKSYYADLYEEYCNEPCETNLNINWLSFQYRVDGTDEYISIVEFRDTGATMFCIEPGKYVDECTDYTDSTITLSSTAYRKVAIAIARYNESPSTNHYIATQLYIWEIMGRSSTVNGNDWTYYWSSLGSTVEARYASVQGEESSYNTVVNTSERITVDFANDNIMVDLNSSFTNADSNSNLRRTLFSISYDDSYSSASINNSSRAVTGTNTSLWPSVKTYTVTPINSSTTTTTYEAGSMGNTGTLYSATNSQSLLSYDSEIEPGTEYNHTTRYTGDSFTTTLRTGSLSLTKVNEYLENAGSGHTFKIWYAVQDSNGTAIDDSGVTWSKYEVFVSEEDWENGLSESTYTTDSNGNITISGLPSGGSFDDGTAIGTYIIQEIDTTNGYTLNGKEYVFTINYNSTTTIEVSNYNRAVGLTIEKYDVGESNGTYHMADDDLLLNGATYTIWDISNTLLDDTGEGNDRYETNYFIKVGNATNLSTLLASEIADVASNNGGITPSISVTEHCDTFTYDESTSVLLAQSTDVVEVSFVNPSDETDIWGTKTIFLVTNDSTLCSGSTCTITGYKQFKATTGIGIAQLVDATNHFLPDANEWLTVYYDEDLTMPYAYYQADDYGVVDFTTANVEYADSGENDDGDGIYWYQLAELVYTSNEYSDTVIGDSLGNITTESTVYSITSRELENGKDEEKGTITVSNLQYGRSYLICETETPDNYDLVDGTNACQIITTDDTYYSNNNDTVTFSYYNAKVTGSLQLTKLDEWYDPVSSGVSFMLYHAQLREWDDLNDMLDDPNDWDLNYDNVVFCSIGYDYDSSTNMCVYNGETQEGSIGQAIDDPQYEATENNYPVLGEPVYGADGTNILTADEDGVIYLENDLHYGWYILVEYDETSAYNINTDYVLFYIGHDGIEERYFTNQNRTVTFEVYKEDIESGYKINEAEFTVWDISDTLDGEDIVSLYFGVKLNEIDLYDLVIDGTELEELIDGRALYYELSDYSDVWVDADGILLGQHPNYLTVTVYGGSGMDIYGTAGDVTVYQGETFDPYADLYFYTDADGTEELELMFIEGTGELDTDTIGEYTLTYTITITDRITYRFDRTVTVIEDDRVTCIYDGESNMFVWSDSGEVCEVVDVSDMLEELEAELEIVLLYNQEENDADWYGTYVTSFNIVITLDDGNLIDNINSSTSENIASDAAYYSLDGILVWTGLTGHKYIQTVDPDNHNLPLAYQEVIIYYDADLIYPYRLYTSDENGMIDLNEDDYVLLAEYPVEKVDENGNHYVDTVQFVEYIDEDGNTLGYEWVAYKRYLEFGEYGLDLVENIETVYWYNPVTQTAESIIFTQQDGRLEITNLKANRTYLVCETALPDGYSYTEVQDACFILNTSEENYGYDDFGDKVTNFNGTLIGGTRYNELRRIDVAVYKTDEEGDVKLNGAIFDVYVVENEGEDANVLDNTIANMQLYIAEDGTLYHKPALGITDKLCDSEYYEYDEDSGTCVLSDDYFLISIGTDVADWKEVLGLDAEVELEVNIFIDDDGIFWLNYTADGIEYSKQLIITEEEPTETVEFTELGTCTSYVADDLALSSMIAVNEYGNYLAEGEEGACYIVYTEATIERSYVGRYVSGGIYVMDGEAEYVEVATDLEMTNIIRTAYLENGEVAITGLSDGIYYTRLSNSEEVIQHYVAKGMIYLPSMQYGYTLLVEEIQAPDGYYFDEGDQYLFYEPIAEYGIGRVDVYRFNKAIVIPPLGIDLEVNIDTSALDIHSAKVTDYFGLLF